MSTTHSPSSAPSAARSAPPQGVRRPGARVRRRSAAVLVVVGLVLGVLLGAGYGLVSTGTHHAGAYLVVAPTATGDTRGDAGGATTYAKAYAEVAGQPEVLDAALAPFATGGRTVDDVARDVTVAASQDAPLVQVSASGDTAQDAVAVAAAASKAVASYLTPTAAASGYTISLLTPAAEVRSASGLTPPLSAALGGVLGVVVAGAVLLLRR